VRPRPAGPRADDESAGDAHDPAADDPAAHAASERQHHTQRELTVRLTVVSGDRQVFVRIKGSSSKKLAKAEAVAKRLLADTPQPEPKKPIGFSATTDTELAEET
jgi:hypothetical protein